MEHDTLTAEQRLGQFELPTLLSSWQARHKVPSLAAAGRKLGVPYRTIQSWARGDRCPRGLGLRLILERLGE